MRATVARFGVGVGLLLSGCALAPPTNPSGLPRVPRYTNSIQPRLLLSSYRAVAEKAAMSSESAKLLDEACLGWERAVLDLHGARLYPSILRQTPETLMLEQVWQDFPKTVEKYPRPAVCDNLKIPVSTSGMPKEVTLGVVAKHRPTCGIRDGLRAGDAASPTPPPVAPSPTAPPADGAGIMPPSHQHAVDCQQRTADAGRPRTCRASATSDRACRCHQTRRPICAERGKRSNAAAGTAGDGGPSGCRELAESDLPTVKLRARYHLLGLPCTLAVENRRSEPHADQQRKPNRDPASAIRWFVVQQPK